MSASCNIPRCDLYKPDKVSEVIIIIIIIIIIISAIVIIIIMTGDQWLERLTRD